MAKERLLLAKFASKNPEEEALQGGIVTVQCPYCEAERLIEPDGDYEDIQCEICGEHYRTRGVC